MIERADRTERPTRSRGSFVVALLVLALVAVTAGCAQEEMPQLGHESTGAPAPSADAGAVSGRPRPDGGGGGTGQCVQALAESLPARIAVMTAVGPTGPSGGGPSAASAPPAATMVTLDQIYGQLWGHCNKCHNSTTAFDIGGSSDFASPGGEGFATKAEEALHHITSDGMTVGAPDEAMPPINASAGIEGLGWTKLKQMYPNSSLVQAAGLLETWLSTPGRPSSFSVGAPPMPAATDAGAASGDASTSGGSAAGYLMTAAVGDGFTNLGNCIPDPSIVATEQSQSADLDAKFAAMKRLDPGEGTADDVIGLPKKLSETDLTTFDGEALARSGVIAFSPQYPLWSDDAGKVRYVRVPRGQSIHFDKATQEFQIPANTRFYKTFLKPIVDTDGNPSWRKIETRLIVARPDTTFADGTIVQNALYGSYLWNPSETDAVLLGTGDADPSFIVSGDAPLNDAEGFKDTVLEYETNAITHLPLRHYAVPSSTRCVQCHMGSPSRSFVLGFRPVQLVHRPVGLGGVIEASGPDEFDLLQRLIDYGVVTGMGSPADVLPLEQSEGNRSPRNDAELTAQGYMLGNCSHCHNPRGYPSVSFPVLKDTLSFLPGPTSGIFQFPLEKFSPRITRGILGNVHIPYITPSLVDNPSYPIGQDPIGGDTRTIAQGGLWRPKRNGLDGFVYAPWRSLIYRNVEAPFTYADDFVIYPHMPVNTPGYDDRAKQILGDWMVSVPAVRKRPEIDEYVAPYDPTCPVTLSYQCPTASDDSEQPYVEVMPGAPGYDAAVAAAQQRLVAFHTGMRPGEDLAVTGSQNRFASFSPVFAADIVDPDVFSDPTCHPTPDEHETPVLGVPTHANWVPLDLTQGSGTWFPRRQDWLDVFTHGVTASGGSGCDQTQGPEIQAAEFNQQCVVNMLNGDDSTLSLKDANGAVLPDPNGRHCASANYDATKVPVSLGSFRQFATTPFPMGLWKENSGCDWTKEPWKSKGPAVADVRASDPQPWLIRTPQVDATAHVYEQTPGEAVFSMICINCHGPQADSRGRLADNLATMTGGRALVADLRDGLFGPGTSGVSNRAAQFGPAATALDPTTGDSGLMLTGDDVAARYMAWMALGGTTVVIPPAFLTIVGQTPVFGEHRRGGVPPPGSANMLSVARELCLQALEARPFDCGLCTEPPGVNQGYYAGKDTGIGLLFDNGDAELWLKLCSFDNPPPVVPYTYFGALGQAIPNRTAAQNVDPALLLHPPIDLLPSAFEGSCSQAGGPCVGDENGSVFASLTSDNHHPWCVSPNGYDNNNAPMDVGPLLTKQCISGIDCDPNHNCTGSFPDPGCVYWPRCPDNAVNDDDRGSAALLWAQRGAINAGLAVFLYLEDVTANPSHIKPPYDQCDALAPATTP